MDPLVISACFFSYQIFAGFFGFFSVQNDVFSQFSVVVKFITLVLWNSDKIQPFQFSLECQILLVPLSLHPVWISFCGIFVVMRIFRCLFFCVVRTFPVGRGPPVGGVGTDLSRRGGVRTPLVGGVGTDLSRRGGYGLPPQGGGGDDLLSLRVLGTPRSCTRCS